MKFAALAESLQERIGHDLGWKKVAEEFSLPAEIIEQVKLIDDMEKDVASRRTALKDLHKRITEKEDELQKSQDRQNLLNLDVTEFKKVSTDLAKKELERGQRLKTMQMKQSGQEGNFDKEKQSMEMYVNRSADLLGLSILKTETESQMIVFTSIDKRDPKRKFVCEFKLDGPENREYTVVRSEPVVADLDEMEQKLNETNDLSGFVTTLRQKFQQLALK